MRICGFQKTTLLDYPEHVAATIFLGGCNFRCPFCHNRDLVLHPDEAEPFSEDEILSYLRKRKGILQGVCITGGEPTLSSDLPLFIRKIKELDYLVKLDTNGSNPDMLKQLYRAHLIDYVAMDIKSGLSGYGHVCGLPEMSEQMISNIRESIRFLIKETDALRFQYEFRTTCVAELHTKESFRQIGKLIEGAGKFYLQSYVDSDHILSYENTISDHSENHMITFHAYAKEDLLTFMDLVRPFVKEVSLRGVE